MKTVLLIITLCVSVFSCDPPRLNFEQAIDTFDLIFCGKVLSVKEKKGEAGPYALTTFAVESCWKGPARKRFVIETALWGCSQTRFRVGDRHLLFARKREDGWFTTTHDQHNVKLVTTDAQETIELMALNDTFKGGDNFSSDTFTSAEIAYLVKGFLTRDDLKEYHRWSTALSKDSVAILTKERDERIAQRLNYAHNGKTVFLFKDSLMTRKEFFYSVEGNCRFRLYEIPSDWVSRLQLQTDHLIMANSSYNFYSHPKPLPELSLDELLLLLEKKIQAGEK